MNQILAKVRQLTEQSGSTEPELPRLVQDASEELQTMIEELTEAQFELKEQNDELLATQHALEKARLRYQDLFDFAPDGYLVTDSTGKILEANQAAADLFKQPRKTIEKSYLSLFVIDEDLPRFRDLLSKIRTYLETDSEQAGEYSPQNSGIRIDDFELTMKSKQRTPLLASINVSTALVDGQIMLRWAIRDVTENQITQITLQENEQYFRALSESIPVAIFIVDRGEILYVNQTALDITGYPSEELNGLYFASLVHPEDKALIDPCCDWPLNKRQRWDLRLTTKQGENCWVEATAASLRYKGRLAWLLSAYDITRRRQMEHERRELLRKLVEIQEEERRRISLELHDQIGQDLVALLLGLKSLEDGLPTEAVEKTRRLHAIAENLRQEIHGLALDLRPTALDDLGLISTLSHYAEEWSELNNIPVHFQNALGNDVKISSEAATAIYRIVQEALTNILRHASAERVSLILEESPGYFLVIIEDNGAGFEVDAVMNPAFSRTHLGLLGMKERAELAGGSLNIESEPGQGTTIFCRIPFPSK